MAIERKPSLIRQRFERVQQVRAFNKSVNEVNNELERTNFGGNITNFNKIYNDIKNQNPQVAARLKYNPQTIKIEVNNRIKQLEKELKEVQEKENRADERNIKDKEKQYRAEQRGLREGLSRLKKGELIKVSDVLRYADDLGDNARNKQRAKEKAELKTTPKPIVRSTLDNKELYVSRKPIKGGKTEYLVNGKWQDFKPKKVQTLNKSKNVAVDNNQALISIIDTSKNTKTVTKVNLRTGQTLDKKTNKLSKKEIEDINKENKNKLDERLKQSFRNSILTENMIEDFNQLPIEAQQSALKLSQDINTLQNNNLLSKREVNAKDILNLSRLEKLDKIREETNNSAYKALLSLGVFTGTLAVLPARTLIGFGEFIANGAPLSEVINGIKNSPNSFRNTLTGISKGDPKAAANLVFNLATLRGVSIPPLNKIKNINLKKKLNNYKSNLLQEKKIAIEYQKVSTPQQKKKVDNRIKEIDKQVDSLNKGTFNGNKFKSKSSAEIARFSKRLEKKNKEAIKKLFETENNIKPIELKIDTTNSGIIKASKEQIIATANALFRSSDNKAFKLYKNKVKKLRNENLVRRNNNFVLLEPKTNLKKGVKTGKKTKTKEVIIEKKPKKEIIIEKKELSIKELDNLEKLMEKEIIQARKSKSKFNKKGSSQVFKSSKRYYNNRKSNSKKIIDNTGDFQRFINDLYKDFQRKTKNKNVKEQKQLSKEVQTKYLGRKNKLKQELKLNKAKNTKFKTILGQYSKLDTLNKTEYVNLQKSLTKLNNDLQQKIIKIDNIKPKNVDIKSDGTPIIRKPRTPNKPKNINVGKGFTPRAIKGRVTKARALKIPELDFNKKPPKGFRYKVDGFASIGRKKVKVVSGLPENKAFNKVFNTGSKKFRGVDNSTAQSFEFRIVGLTKAKDDKNKKGISKVTKSKGSTKTVLKLKEKSRARIDTKGEKKGLKLRRKTKKR